MNRHYLAVLGVMSGLLSVTAYAAPGEYWEITNKMEMPGMPFAMPATTQKFCIAKGSENNPEKTAGDKNCKMTDVKTIGNKTTWKARCDHDGEIMTGIGEQTSTAGGYEGKMQFSSKSSGHDMNMTMAFSGKRVGGSCDTEEQDKKMKAQICDTSHYRSTADWISGSDLILQPGSACGEQRQQLCDMVRKDTPRDVQAYNSLQMHEQHMLGGISIARECKLDMAATTKSICKKLDGENYNQLSASCPAEAKTYREVTRRKECEGRSYTAATRAADIRRCMGGVQSTEDDGSQSESPAAKSSGKSTSGNTADDLMESAKKLRSKYGF